MKIEFYYNDTTYEINPERIALDERLDEALDSMNFCFTSSEITTDVPPFTKMIVTDGTTKTYFYVSTTCDEIVEMPGYYFHTAQAVEVTKILETWIIGSKAFSVIDGKDNYNKGYNRLEILNLLVEQDYGVEVTLDTDVTTLLTDERAYSFGAGTTYYDIALEICKANNCLPRVTYVSNDGKNVTVGVVNIGALPNDTNTATFNVIEKVSKTQSVDEYCSNVVTEMNAVVDRDNLTTCIITPRSASETIYKDNALLRLPSNCESIYSVYAWMKGFNGPTIKIPASMLDFSSTTTYDKDVVMMTANLSSWIATYGVNDTFKAGLTNIIHSIESMVGKTEGYYDECALYWEKDNYCLITLWKATDYDSVYHDGWVSIGLLNKGQWDLLTTTEQPAYIYYDTDSNVIDGFNTYKDNSFWNAIIFGERGPFLKEFYQLGTENTYQRTLKYVDFDDISGAMLDIYTGVSLDYVTNYCLMEYENGMPSTDIRDYRWMIKYYAKPCIRAYEKKNLSPDNESSWKSSTRSYNNGANTVDFNQLIPAMKRSVDMLGLETTTVESLDDVAVGKKTQYGYIISKQTNLNLYAGEKVINNVVYNCCKNYQQIAAAIGVQTQYEATNVPSNDIVTRYVTVEKSMASDLYDAIAEQSNIPYIMVSRENTGDVLSKAAARLAYDNEMYLIVETEDNYTFDYQKIESNVANYYKRNPVPYSDDDQCATYYNMVLYLQPETDSSVTNDELDMLPNYVFGSQYTTGQRRYVYKDSRERLIFQFHLKRSS